MRNTKNFSHYATKKISPIFVILLVIVVGAFSFAMFNLHRDPTPEELRVAYNNQMNAAMLAEEAQVTGLSEEEIQRRWQERDRKQRLMAELNTGISQQNNTLVARSLSELTKKDFYETGNLVFRNAVVADNENAFRLLLEKGIACNNQSVTGENAFRSAISSANPSYLRMLLDNRCDYAKDRKQPSLEERIINSAHPDKIFLLSEKHFNPDSKEKAFLKAIKKGMYEQVQTMLDLGADPNTPNALAFSFFSGGSKISFLLINNGADIKAKSTRSVHVLTSAFMWGKMDVVREILKRDPQYIQREQIEPQILSSIFHLSKNPTAVRESITLLLDHGLKKSRLIQSYPWLKKAINLPDYLLVDQLLDIGKDVYNRSTIEKRLKYLESSKINQYHKEKMLNSLHKFSNHTVLHNADS